MAVQVSGEEGGFARLVPRTQDFIRANDELSGSGTKKKLEFKGDAGYPLPYITQADELAHGRGALVLFRPFPRLPCGLPALPTQDGSAPE